MDTGEKIDISNETSEYETNDTKINKERELRVINALKSGNFVTNKNTSYQDWMEGVCEEVWSFFAEMYKKRKSKIKFFNILFPSPFRKAFEDVNENKKQNVEEKVKYLLKEAANNKKKSILNAMEKETIWKSLQKYANKRSRDWYADTAAGGQDKTKENYNKLLETWKQVIELLPQYGTDWIITVLTAMWGKNSNNPNKEQQLVEGLKSYLKPITKKENKEEAEKKLKEEEKMLEKNKDESEKRKKALYELYELYCAKQGK